MKIIKQTSNFYAEVIVTDSNNCDITYCSTGNLIPRRGSGFRIRRNESDNDLEITKIVKQDKGKLLIGTLWFKEDEKYVYFEEEYVIELGMADGIGYIKKDGKQDKLTEECLRQLLEDYNILGSYSNEMEQTFYNYAHCLMLEKNEEIYQLLIETIDFSSIYKGWGYDFKNITKNLLYMALLLDPYILENIAKSGLGSILIDFLSGKVSFDELKKGNTTSDILGIPKFVINFLKENELTEGKTVKLIKDITEMVKSDGLKIFVEFCEESQDVLSFDKHKFFTNLAQTYKYIPDYSASKLRDYLLRSIFNYNNFDINDILNTLNDYLKMCIDLGIEPERYPQNLYYYHDRLVEKYKVFKQEHKNKEFMSAIDNYKFLCNYIPVPEKPEEVEQLELEQKGEDIEIVVSDTSESEDKDKEKEEKKQEFTIVAPANIADLAREGEILSHCVGSYVDRIISGDSRIFFVRRVDLLEKPLVTVELDEKCKLRQARAKSNQDPSAKIMEFIHEWVANIKNGKQTINLETEDEEGGNE